MSNSEGVVRPVGVVIADHKNFMGTINELLGDSYTVLDVGCGVGVTVKEFICPIKIGIDIHRSYLENAHPIPNFIKLNLAAERLSEIFPTNSVDSITLIDVIEHFEKPMAYSVLSQAEAVAAKKVIIFTPRGFFRQAQVDHYGLGGEKYQEHLSGWEIEEFQALGYNVIVFPQFHNHKNLAFLRAYGQNGVPIDALLAWKNCSII